MLDNTAPLVSVIIPTHNREDLLEKAILSVINQTYTNIEIIVVDDNSNDETPSVVKRLKKRHGNIKYIRKNRTPHNPAATRNDGIKKSKGEFIAFLDDDDKWLPKKTELQVAKFLEDDMIGLISTKYIETDGQVEKIMSGVGTSSVMVRKCCLDDVGLFDEKLTCAEDRDLYERILEKYGKHLVDEALVIHRSHPGQISSNIKLRIDSEKYYIKKHFTVLKSKGELYRNYFVLGSLYIKVGDFLNAEKSFKKSMDLNGKFRKTQSYLIALRICPNLFKWMLGRFGNSQETSEAKA